MTSESPLPSIQCPEIVQEEKKKMNCAPLEHSSSIQWGVYWISSCCSYSVVSASCSKAAKLCALTLLSFHIKKRKKNYYVGTAGSSLMSNVDVVKTFTLAVFDF